MKIYNAFNHKYFHTFECKCLWKLRNHYTCNWKHDHKFTRIPNTGLRVSDINKMYSLILTSTLHTISSSWKWTAFSNAASRVLALCSYFSVTFSTWELASSMFFWTSGCSGSPTMVINCSPVMLKSSRSTWVASISSLRVWISKTIIWVPSLNKTQNFLFIFNFNNNE